MTKEKTKVTAKEGAKVCNNTGTNENTDTVGDHTESIPTPLEQTWAAWDELDRLVDQLRSMAMLLQFAQVPWPGTPMLTPYMQTMDDLLTRINHMHHTLRQIYSSLEAPKTQ